MRRSSRGAKVGSSQLGRLSQSGVFTRWYGIGYMHCGQGSPLLSLRSKRGG